VDDLTTEVYKSAYDEVYDEVYPDIYDVLFMADWRLPLSEVRELADLEARAIAHAETLAL